MVREQAIIHFVNGYIVSLTFVSVWILWLDVLLIINGYLLSLFLYDVFKVHWVLNEVLSSLVRKHFLMLNEVFSSLAEGSFLFPLTVLNSHLISECFLNSNRCLRLIFTFWLVLIKSYGIWRPPILPHRLQCSTFGRLCLNRRVRDGNGCFP